MKKAGFILSIILVTIFYSGQVQSQSMFQKIIGQTATDEWANNSQMTADSGHIIVGYTDGFGAGGQDFYLVKLDNSGEVEWTQTYGGISNDIAYDVQPTADGGYILVGETSSFGAGSQDILLIKTDSVGDTLWTRTYGGTGIDVAYSVKQTFDGGYVLTGYTGSFGTGSDDIYVIKTNSSGDTSWTKTYGAGAGGDYAYCIIQTADSGYAITGEEDYTGANDAFLIKTDAMGDTLWTKTYGGGGAEGGWSVIETMDGGYAFTGWTNTIGAGSLDLFLVKTDAMGDTLWTRAYGGTSNDAGLYIKETSDTTYLMSGYTYSFGTVLGDAYVIEAGSTGTLLWSMAYGGVLGDLATSLEKSGTGYVVSGYSFSFGSSGNGDFYTIHTDSMGSSGACYELASATLTSAASTTVAGINVTSVMNSIVGMTGLTATNPAVTSRANYDVSISGSSNNACNGASLATATAVVVGGTLNYTYSWDDGMSQTSATADSLAAGTYQVMVTDGQGCMDSVSVTLTDPSAIVLMISDSSHLACNGDGDGSATVSASGGTGPLSFLWDDPSATADSVLMGVNGGAYINTTTDSLGCMMTISFTINEPAAISLSVASTVSVSCNADSSATVTATASGGNGTLSYLWDDQSAQTTSVATGIPNGSYKVVVTDTTGCSIMDSLTFGILASISSSASPVCGGICDGTASLAVTGNSGTVTYSWNDALMQTTSTASSLCSGSSFIGTVTDTSGCSASATATFPSLSALSVILNLTNINCFGNTNGAATVFVSGGGTPYTYWWPSLGIGAAFVNSLVAGNYDVIITDGNGCTIVETASITEPAAALGSSMSITAASCFGGADGAANLTVTGGTTPYMYDWPTSIKQDTSGMEAGTYIVDITDDNGCTTSDTAIITQATSVLASGSSSADAGGGTGMAWVSASGGTAPYIYMWDDPNSQTGDTATALMQGEYSVVITDAKGCTVILEIAVGDQSVGVFETSYEGSFDDLARDMDILSSGGHIVAGVTESFGSGGSDMYLLSSDVNGNFNWAKAYGGSGDDGANSVIQTSDGGYIMAGYTSSFGSGNTDMYVVKTDVNGVIEWTQTYGGSGNESAYSIVENTGGYVIAGGTNSFGAGNTDVYAVGIDDNGAILWTKTYGGSDYDYGYDIESTTDGGYIIAGYTNSFGAGGADAYLIKINASGASTWTKVMGGDEDDAAWAVIETSTGYAFTGNTESFGSGQQDVYFVITDATGTPTLTTAFGGSQLDYGNDLTATTDGGYAITGYSQSFNTFGDDVYIIKTDVAGEVIWSRTFGGSFADRAWAIQETSSGELVIAGNSRSFGLSVIAGFWEYYLIKTDSDGDSQCNLGSATTTNNDTLGAPITIGGLEGSGGTASSATTVEVTTTTLSEILCYNTTDIQKLAKEPFELGLYPNPNNGQFTLVVKLASQKAASLIRVFNVNGELLRSERISGNGNYKLDIDLGEVPAGMYYVQVISDGVFATRKVIVQ